MDKNTNSKACVKHENLYESQQLPFLDTGTDSRIESTNDSRLHCKIRMHEKRRKYKMLQTSTRELRKGEENWGIR